MLSRRLAIPTHEVLEIKSRLRRIADLATVGMFHVDPSGMLIYANEDYYTYACLPVETKLINTKFRILCRLTEHPRDVSYPLASDVNAKVINFVAYAASRAGTT